ncbi:MAG: hypothetical protein JXB35_12290 [Anaerolineae bacterium]|nr:hypothetical protein [Anaerolineae bacterium]
MSEPKLEILAETEMYGVLATFDESGDRLYHLELGTVTVHLLEEEWQEFLELMRQAMR